MAQYDSYLATNHDGVLTLGPTTNDAIGAKDKGLDQDDLMVFDDRPGDDPRAPAGLFEGREKHQYGGTVFDAGNNPVGFIGVTGPADAPVYTVFVPAGIDPAVLTLTLLTLDTVNPRTQPNLEAAAPVCFLAGTGIRTPGGDVAVETLRPGSLVLTTEGAAAPVRWLGRCTVSRVFGDPVQVLPIRIRAGALADNVPSRDLLVSADHALLVDGVLIHAGALVNGASILREADVPETITYYHVELADHSLILAANVPAETFLDKIDRMAFDNWAEHEAPHPGAAPMTEMAFARARSHRQVPQSTRLRLMARAAAMAGQTGTNAA